MRILYLSLSYLPSHHASSVQVMRMCSALASLGHEVRLIAKRSPVDQPPHRLRVAARPGQAGTCDRDQDLHAFYGVTGGFEIETLARPRWRGGGMVYLAAIARELVTTGRTADLVYCRDIGGAFVASELDRPVVFEAHAVPEPAWQRQMWRRIIRGRGFRGLVAISAALARDLESAKLSTPHAPIVVAPSSTDVIAGAAPRTTLSSPPRIGYVGNLYDGRGIELILELARRMPACRFELIGGSEHDLARWRAHDLPGNFILHGFQPPAALPELYRGFDVLLMPYPRHGVRGASGGAETTNYCSPVKMFEYMSAAVPMVASDLPVLQEVLTDGRNALIAPADNAPAWQTAIERLLASAELRSRLASTALADLRERYTSDARARRILEGIQL